MTQFEKALSRILMSNMDAGGITQVFKNIMDTKVQTGAENSAVTLGFNPDQELTPGDIVPTLTFSLMTVPELEEPLEED